MEEVSFIAQVVTLLSNDIPLIANAYVIQDDEIIMAMNNVAIIHGRILNIIYF